MRHLFKLHLHDLGPSLSYLEAAALLHVGGLYGKTQSEASSEVPSDAATAGATETPPQKADESTGAARTAILAAPFFVEM